MGRAIAGRARGVYTDAVPPEDASLPLEPTEIVRRPDPGTLARGAWEAPAWAFYVAAAVVLVAAVLYAASRLGLLKRARTKR